MSSFNLTNPENPAPVERDTGTNWDHKEATVEALIELGVPRGPAELAVIDYRGMLNACQRGKLTPVQTADMMLEKVEDVYRNEDGTWKFDYLPR